MTETTNPQPSLRAVFTVTVESRKGAAYFDRDGFVLHAVSRIEGALESSDDIRDVIVVEAEPAAPVPPPAPTDRAAFCHDAAERITAYAADHFPDEYDEYADRLADEVRRMAVEAPAPNRAGGEGRQGCPTPESHNWGCGCPGDRLPLYSDRGVDTPGCDCGHNGMGMRWHDGGGCAWFKQLTEEGRRLLAEDDGGEAQQPEKQAGQRETVEYFLQAQQDDGTWEDASSFMNAPDWASERLAGKRAKYPDFSWRMAERTTTVTVRPLPDCLTCRHWRCNGDGPCGALLDAWQRCTCPGPAAVSQPGKEA